MREVRISIDAMGGDKAPDVVFEGIEEFMKKNSGFRFLLHGDEKALIPLRARMSQGADLCEIIHCDQHIPMDMKPSQAVRQGRESSMWRAVQSVREGKAEAVVSAGNTGALMAMSKMIFDTMEGVRRPALITSWTTQTSSTAVLDVGASVKADARQLVEFTIMGEAYARAIHKKARPRVGILNVGVEAVKGKEEMREAVELISNCRFDMDFVGFVEGYDISRGTMDVVVVDGFTGNVLIKAVEGVLALISRNLEDGIRKSPPAVAEAFATQPSLLRVREFFNSSDANGGVFLGLNGLTVKSHGGTDKYGFASSIGIAAHVSDSRYAEEVSENLRRLQNAQSHIPTNER